ncbi:MAG: hypothetical protein CMO55_01540 [Verrucomicrobiales bacterium]|nr:hypothetical protein [Verrucomicrobiales bacterium]
MKTIFLPTLAALILILPSAIAHPGHHHHSKPGPNGGRVLGSVTPHLEFVVRKDRKVQIVALDDEGKATAIGKQVVRVKSGSRSNPTILNFRKWAGKLVSDARLPEGEDIPITVEIQAEKGAPKTTAKFSLDVK